MSETTTAPGWYPNGQGQHQYWDGQQWTQDVRPDSSQSSGPEQNPAPRPVGGASGLSVAALILAILVAPVGLILGIVAAVQSRKRTGKAGGLAIASIIVGAVLTVIQFATIIISMILLMSATTAGNKVAFCASVAANESELAYLVQMSEIVVDPEPDVFARVQAFQSTADQLRAYAWNDSSRSAVDTLLQGIESSKEGSVDWHLFVGSGAESIVGTELYTGVCQE